MKDDSHLYLDHVQLKARGWSRNLVKKFLIKPDRWETVDHWANFMGKATYFVERVMQEESRAEFQRAFEASRKRRKLTPEDLTVIETERARVNNSYRKWLKTVTPEDVKTMLIIKKAAAIFEEIRARGYRTPHK